MITKRDCPPSSGPTFIVFHVTACDSSCSDPDPFRRTRYLEPSPTTKHVDIQHHFVREKLISNEIEIQYCATEDDSRFIYYGFTKALPKPKHENLVKRLGMAQGSRGSVGIRWPDIRYKRTRRQPQWGRAICGSRSNSGLHAPHFAKRWFSASKIFNTGRRP